MKWEGLTKQSQAYVDRYIRTSDKTREQALQEKIVQETINEYETGTKERMIFV